MTAYEPGDRVRVVLEGVVKKDGRVSSDNGEFALYDNVLDHAVSIEKIEPPAVTFKPGDVVRAKDSGSVFAIREGGRWLLVRGSLHPRGYESQSSADFTSENFELVDLDASEATS